MNKMSKFTIPALQGTLAKRTKPTLLSNFAKEPFSPSRPNTCTAEKQFDKKETNRLRNNNGQRTTHGIVHAGFRGFRRFVNRKKSRCKLIGNRLVIPHDTIPSYVGQHLLEK